MKKRVFLLILMFLTLGLVSCNNQKNETYKIIFRDEDGTVLKIDDFKHGEIPVFTDSLPVKENTAEYSYIFVGWFPEITPVKENKEYTAVYKSTINNFQVIFKDYDGQIIKSQTVNYGDSALAPEGLTRDGYDFIGWDKEFNNIIDNIIVNAKYKIKAHTVSFDTAGGSSISDIKVDDDKFLTKPQNPTKTGYIFEGWYVDNSLINKFDFNTKITKDIILKAKWIAEEDYLYYYAKNNNWKTKNEYLYDSIKIDDKTSLYIYVSETNFIEVVLVTMDSSTNSLTAAGFPFGQLSTMFIGQFRVDIVGTNNYAELHDLVGSYNVKTEKTTIKSYEKRATWTISTATLESSAQSAFDYMFALFNYILEQLGISLK